MIKEVSKMFDTSIKERKDFDSLLNSQLEKLTSNTKIISAGDELMVQRLGALCRKNEMTISDFFYKAEVERTGRCSAYRIPEFKDCMNALELIRVLYGMSKYEFAILPDRDRGYYKNLIRKLRNVTDKKKCYIYTIVQFVLPLGISPAMFFRFTELLMYMNIDTKEIVQRLDTFRELKRRGKIELLYIDHPHKRKGRAMF